MARLQEAQQILADLGMPAEQRNEIAGYTLLVLAGVRPRSSWKHASGKALRVHDMLSQMAEEYGKRYAENTRETARRRVLHQFEQARIVDRNPDAPGLPTNSPRTHYALNKAALSVITAFGTRRYRRVLQAFLARQPSLLDVYCRAHRRRLVPVTLPDGRELRLSPGKHNELQAAVVKHFGPRFAPGAQVLYLSDAANKDLWLATDILAKMGVPVSVHDKLPDVVFLLESRNLLFLVEVVTAHGPVTSKRHIELERALRGTSAGRVYVSAFPDFAEFKRHVEEIAWETEVWIAEMPDHMIHFNGERFLGPSSATASPKAGPGK
jgi:hypothetical protein